MKKIVALVLTLVLALSLATVAFGETAKTVTGYVMSTDKTGGLVDSTAAVTFTYTKAADPTVDKTTGYTTGWGHVAYYTLDATGVKYVVVDSLAAADVVLYNSVKADGTGKDVIMYLAVENPDYFVAKAFTNFGEKCGQFDYAAYDKTATYYSYEFNGDTYIRKADKDGAASLMVNGKLVSVGDAVLVELNGHTAVPTVKDGETVGYTCSVCGAVAVKAANKASIPATAEQIGDTLWYFAAAGTAATTGVASAKTFDAGVALYAGMALMSVAGSAVVIGKKKEF